MLVCDLFILWWSFVGISLVFQVVGCVGALVYILYTACHLLMLDSNVFKLVTFLQLFQSFSRVVVYHLFVSLISLGHQTQRTWQAGSK